MQRPLLKAIGFTGIVSLMVGGILMGNRWVRQRQFRQEVLGAIQEPNNMLRMTRLAELRDTKAEETLTVLIAALDSPDPALRRQAARGLPFFRDSLAEYGDVIARRLRQDSDPRVRLACAIVLMWVNSPATDQAYIEALQDTEDKVVQIAITELGERKRAETDRALFATLHHPSWRVRLEVCKALITSGAADSRVVSELEAMRQDAEAPVYDTETADFEQREKELVRAGEAPLAHWGKLEDILKQARTVQAKNQKGSDMAPNK